MGKSNISKVMKFEAAYVDGCGDFHEMQRHVWSLQKQTREILNRTLQICFRWKADSRERYRETGVYPDLKTETGYKTLDGCAYHLLRGQYGDMAAGNLATTVRRAYSKWASSEDEVFRGTVSLPSFRRDQPLLVRKSNVAFSREKEDRVLADLGLFSEEFKKRTGYGSHVRFRLTPGDGTQRAILERLLSGEYGHGECQLVYKRPKWFLFLTYNFPPQKLALDPERILGVDLGEVYALYASVLGEKQRLNIEGGEVTAFAQKLEALRRSMQRQARYCGEGRVGHGTKTRVDDVFKAEERIADFRATINHRYSKAVVEYAVRNRCGTIQMEDLTGIRGDTGFPKHLRHWTYYDLQTKIEAKARERDIRVVRVKPQYTSLRCSKCGHIEEANRPSQERFLCARCGFRENADYNASQNLATRDIDQIIAKERGADPERT